MDFNCNVDKKLVVNLIKKVQKKKAIVKALVFDSGNHTLLKGKSNTINFIKPTYLIQNQKSLFPYGTLI